MQNNGSSRHRRCPSGSGNAVPAINELPDKTCAGTENSTSAAESTPGEARGDSPAVDPEENPSMGSSTARNGILRQMTLKLRLSSLRRRSPRPNPIKSPAARALMGLKFIVKDVDWKKVEKRFDELTAGTADGLLPRHQVPECIIGMEKDQKKGMDEESKKFASVLFEAVARRHNFTGESISKEQFQEFWGQVVDPGFDSRVQTFFDMVDKDGNGKIVEDEIKEIISLSASANHLSNIQSKAGEYARLIMEELDPKGRGYIMIENLEMILLQPTPTYSAAASAEMRRKLSKTWSDKLKPTQENVVKRSFRYLHYHLVDNWQRVWVLALWIAAMAGLYAYKYVQYKNKAAFSVMGHCVCVAKGAAETLKLNMGLMLVMMCRKTITWLRNNTRLGAAIPFDDNINFHQVIAMAIVIGTIIHTVAHMACDFPRILHASPEKFMPILPLFKHQPTSYWQLVKACEGLTGIAMVILMLITFSLASPCLRRKELPKLPKLLKRLTGFNAFWYSHHLFIVLYILLIIHGLKLYLTNCWYYKTTWMYLAIPIVLYSGERLIRAFRSTAEDVQILTASMHPGNVLALKMSKPEGFKYKSGQYIFVKCADVSPFEWHPFSITSAPKDDYISVHIRVLGDWTRQLKVIFQACQEKSELLSQEDVKYPKVLIDGPYGAPTQDFKDYEIVLLVGLGIGATPMISVVKDIAINIQEKKRMEEAKQSQLEEGRISGSNHGKNSDFKIKKAYLYWVTREQGSFDWFHDVMDEVSGMDCNDVVEMHNYCTCVYEEGDVRSALIAMLQAIQHAKNGVDIVSGTRVKSHFGKPIWEDVFKTIALNHPESTIGVFYCGRPSPMKLRHLASDYSHKIGTRFVFHKENF